MSFPFYRGFSFIDSMKSIFSLERHMPETIIQGRLSHKLRSLATSTIIFIQVAVRRMTRGPLVPTWSFLFEYASLFFRAQFNHAFKLRDMNEARAYFDSLYTVLESFPDVDVRPAGDGEPRGDWVIPKTLKTDATLLYFHGGGYAFYAAVSRHFIKLLAHTLGIAIFAPDYRLTPEHPHPAQIDDALAACRFVLSKGINPRKLIVGGDSAGGHLVLMTLLKLRESAMPQPVLAFALSPWTDTGLRGASQFGHDPYDLVQGYMTLRFAEWLKGNPAVGDQVSPIYQDFRGLGPIYLQAGDKEILVDMIRDFAKSVRLQGGHVRLDVWQDMNHEFHAYGEHLAESRMALEAIRQAISWALGETARFAPAAQTEVDCL